ncbi:MAG: hypothetical protein A2902_07205 [Elusimicrobia bacterium RIFCSPLOWO2_01_FULL_64_13]|nr:MAG: hypothetical protein A2902_07205 [Elusimicrobia bacterium RIFCSPLOWO2_01_FULL_64_13]
MIAQFSLIPLGTKTDSLSGALAKAVRIVAESGLPYKTGPMGTAVEGSWEEVTGLIDRCRKAVLEENPRVLISISIDDRKGKGGRLEGKVESLEEKAGIRLKR